MGLLTGSALIRRSKRSGRSFNPDDIIERLQATCDDTLASADGVQFGWRAGRHVSDRAFSTANVYGNFVVWDMSVTKRVLPADKLKEAYEIELTALADGGRPNRKHRKEAKEFAVAKLEEDAKDGRYDKTRLVPCLLRDNGEVWFGGASSLEQHFYKRFELLFPGETLQLITPSTLLRDRYKDSAFIDQLIPSPFGVDSSPETVSWCPDPNYPEWLGNEFLFWLWTTAYEDVFSRPGVVYMPADILALEDPAGLTGHEVFRNLNPTTLPEAAEAVRANKWPRRMGLNLNVNGDGFRLVLHGDTWTVSGLRPVEVSDSEDPREVAIDRLEGLATCVDTLDELFADFMKVRANGEKWLKWARYFMDVRRPY